MDPPLVPAHAPQAPGKAPADTRHKGHEGRHLRAIPGRPRFLREGTPASCGPPMELKLLTAPETFSGGSPAGLATRLLQQAPLTALVSYGPLNAMASLDGRRTTKASSGVLRHAKTITTAVSSTSEEKQATRHPQPHPLHTPCKVIASDQHKGLKDRPPVSSPAPCNPCLQVHPHRLPDHPHTTLAHGRKMRRAATTTPCIDRGG